MKNMVPRTLTALRSVFTVFISLLFLLSELFCMRTLATLMAALCFLTSAWSRGLPPRNRVPGDSDASRSESFWNPVPCAILVSTAGEGAQLVPVSRSEFWLLNRENSLWIRMICGEGLGLELSLDFRLSFACRGSRSLGCDLVLSSCVNWVCNLRVKFNPLAVCMLARPWEGFRWSCPGFRSRDRRRRLKLLRIIGAPFLAFWAQRLACLLSMCIVNEYAMSIINSGMKKAASEP